MNDFIMIIVVAMFSGSICIIIIRSSASRNCRSSIVYF